MAKDPGQPGREPGKTVRKRPARRSKKRYLVSSRQLYGILMILCVCLVGALVWEQYYDTHTYEKGELARLSEGENKPRKKFMTEKQEEGLGGTGQEGENGKSKSGGETEEGSTAGAEGNGNGETEAGGSGKTGTDGSTGQPGGEKQNSQTSSRTVVETSTSVKLKNELLGVLPGIRAPGQTAEELIAQADRLAAMYDYDKAMELLKNCSSYQEDPKMQEAVAGYQAARNSCVEYPVDQVTHIFFHTLIKDAAKAFDGDQYESGYNQYMVTIHEFNSIIEQMYQKGYVLVTLEDMAPTVKQENGEVVYEKGKILLPEGKIPFVLSQDDVSYYHYMDGDGFASRLIIDENGDVKNEYIEEDGSVSVGDYDMIPLIDIFVEQHPDFSYRGAKGYIALTGYDGILGYRTDICYKTREDLTTYQEMFFQEHPDFDEADFERECEEAARVAEALKEDGWLFASHTWGHVGLGEGATTFEQFKADTDKWEERVEPLIGETDTLIFAFGGDIGGVEDYSGQRFEYLKDRGFHYFCGVDSAVCWIQRRDHYYRQARRNVDGYRMYYNPEMLTDLFDVSKAWDPMRPEYVPPI